jgi:RNA polymerase sigma-70 factor (ECF subfamily)
MAKNSNSGYNFKKDEELMVLIQSKNSDAMEELYKRYSKRMLGFFYQMLNKDENKAQDFLHDLFLKCIEKAWLFNPEKIFRTWFFTIASNMCKNEYRLVVAKNAFSQIYIPDVADEEFNIFFSAIDENIIRNHIERSIQMLEPKHKEVFLLRFQEELSVKEISEILEIPEGTVKSRIFNSLKKLQNRLVEFNPKL